MLHLLDGVAEMARSPAEAAPEWASFWDGLILAHVPALLPGMIYTRDGWRPVDMNGTLRFAGGVMPLSSGAYARVAVPPGAQFVRPTTHLWNGRAFNKPGDDVFQGGFAIGGSGNWVGGFHFWDSPGWRFRFADGSSEDGTSSSDPDNDGRDRTLIGLVDATAQSYWINAQQVSSSGSTTTGTIGATPYFGSGPVHGGSGSPNTLIRVVACWRRILSPNEIRRISQDPLGPFRRAPHRARYIPSGSSPQTATPAQASFSWSGQTPTGSPGSVSPSPSQATVSWSALTPTAVPTLSVTPSQATFTWSAQDPIGMPGTTSPSPAIATVTWSGLTPTGSAGAISATPGQATWTLSGLAPSGVPGAITPEPSLATVTWSAFGVTGDSTTIGTTTQASFTWSGITPTGSPGAITATPAVPVVTWTGLAPSGVPGSVSAAPPLATMTWSALDAALSSGVFAEAAPAAFTWTSIDPVLVPGAIVAVPGVGQVTFSVLTPTGAAGGVAGTPSLASMTWSALSPLGVDPGAGIRSLRAVISGGYRYQLTISGGYRRSITIEGA